MDNYVIWKPEHDGHAPRGWKDGMPWGRDDLAFSVRVPTPRFWVGNQYKVPPEAVNPPVEIRHLLPVEKIFDVEAWLEQGRANADKLPDGVVLPPTPLDPWAESIHEALRAFRERDETSVSKDREDQIRYIMAHCQPREASNG